MLNEERIKLMTKMAAYEENEGKQFMAIGSYFRSDYMGKQVIHSVISATIAYLVVLGLYIYYHFESLMQEIYKLDLLGMGKRALFYYAIFVAGYAVITYIVYSVRYNRARKSLRRYYNHLKQLLAMYDLENK
ncbi:MAG: hypothetical protein K6E18_03470 [Lachnospiraceae bacterium]|nr:hypothetical protein [Lachnospiraceae bacterium]